MGINNNQSFFIEEISQYDIIDESYSIMYKDMQNWHNLQLAIYECVLNEGNIINFIKDIIHKIIETLKKWWKNITDFIKKVINNIKSKLSGRDKDTENIDPKLLKDVKVSRELVLMVLHGKEFINYVKDEIYAGIETMTDDIDIDININATPDDIKNQLERKISNADDVKEQINMINNENYFMEEVFKKFDVREGDKIFLDNSAMSFDTFNKLHQAVRKDIETCTSVLDEIKKKFDKVIPNITKKLNELETNLAQVSKDDDDLDKLVKNFITTVTSIFPLLTSIIATITSSFSKILINASNEFDDISNSLSKKSK